MELIIRKLIKLHYFCLITVIRALLQGPSHVKEFVLVPFL